MESALGSQLKAKTETWTVRSFVKRTIDIAGALIGLLLLSPVFLTIATLMKAQEPTGPIFFRQIRVGKNMHTFKMIKFRSMVVNAEERLRMDVGLYRKYIENNYKLEPEEDPRITRLGRFLRKSSLDELPQLWNVLRGEMSLVGPRPVVREELREYGDRLMDFLSVKPGITGYWQISGRSDVGYPERVDLELYYAFNQSLRLDLKIIVLTIWHVLRRKGAY
ncbi:sugar transferase [Cohnella thermotolerans]|uniref:sugar transferase n=1 Tax=Cohnella thermotolerans TaxID=329858 RepID=UPI000A04B15A|nr:sugar transferase [Cohnella thermotolerans]